MQPLTKKYIDEIIEIFKALYPEPECTLVFSHDYELLFATRLSAQCTDARVNIVTAELFIRFPSLQAFAEADITDLEAVVKPCGFYKHKAADLQGMAQKLLAEHSGVVPEPMDALLALPGVGRKTANLVRGELFGKPAVVTDTHCIRLSNRLGFCATTDPAKTERALQEIIPPAEQLGFCHRCVAHGRAVCTARKPRCGDCAAESVCPKVGV